ncbi:hypothetical protein EFP84_13025 [Leptospira kmetyi]|uniref:Uncharacterized protein n=1 Tax=Leptospira kmetyi TaxID=408139 RepID=A0A5F1XP58_9LEPT|nr:hypothetical protein EFP84_13025 [Leptospira kmetyi]TGK15832.1 hypothetical protein EHO62_08640 [Leptospira kmetyi]TGK31862.1 hypothetical protein EHO66_05620 [Leptospira kmetyi]TGL66565.1 hypothetical protein EHQ67_16040 [Leptospira kmetyi]
MFYVECFFKSEFPMYDSRSVGNLFLFLNRIRKGVSFATSKKSQQVLFSFGKKTRSVKRRLLYH